VDRIPVNFPGVTGKIVIDSRWFIQRMISNPAAGGRKKSVKKRFLSDVEFIARKKDRQFDRRRFGW
jgi:hypothetical protein